MSEYVVRRKDSGVPRRPDHGCWRGSRQAGERVKALGPALSGLGVPGLVQGAARTMRAELDNCGGAGLVPTIGKGSHDRQRELPAFDRGRDDHDRGGHGR